MGGAIPTYQMPVDPAAALASNQQAQDAFQALNLASPDRFYAQQAIQPINTHPEAVGQGIAEGLQSAIGNIAGAYAMRGMRNGVGGFSSAAAAKEAAPYAAGVSNVPGVGYVPQAQGISYQPDQMERMYGYGYGNL